MKISHITSALILLLSCFAMPVFGANLFITVLEKGSGGPVEGATVVLGQTGEYDVTDDTGIILFEEVDPVSKIKILHVGYETLEESIDKTAETLTFYLYPVSLDGESLEVVEERIKEKISKLTLVETELRRVPGTAGDPLKVMTTLPGIVATKQSGPGQLYVRGSGREDNDIKINRIPVEYLYHFGDLSGIAPSTINPALLKNFNAFLGGFPVEYDDKLGGVLDVQLRNPKNDRIHQTYRLAVHESAFLVEGPVQEKNDNDSFYVAGRLSYLDRLLTASFVNKLINDGKNEEDSNFTIVTLPRYYDAQASWHRTLKKGYLDVYYFTAGDSVAVNLNNAARNTDPYLIGELSVKLGYHSVGANWFHRYNKTLSQVATWSFRQFNRKQKAGTDPVTQESYFIDTKKIVAAFDPQIIWRKSLEHEFTTGANFSRIWTPIDMNSSVDPTEDNPNQNFTRAEKFRIDTTVNAGIIAPYLKHRWLISKNLTSIMGLRYSYAKASGGAKMSGFSPRATLEYQFNSQLLLNATWGRYLQMPKSEVMVPGFGNPQLGFTHAEHRIIGAEYKPNSLWLIKLEAYHKPMENLVLFVPNTTQPNNFQGIGKGNAYGIDLLVKREFSNRTLGWLSYSYARSSRTLNVGDDERNFTGDQPHTLNFVWSQPMTGSWKRWTWGVKMTIQSGAVHTPVIGRTAICKNGDNFSDCPAQAFGESSAGFSHWEPIKAIQNIERLPFHYQMSLRLDRDIRFNTWKMNFFIDVQNLSFRKNIVNYNYGSKYEKINNREPVAAFYFPLPLLGIEAKF